MDSTPTTVAAEPNDTAAPDTQVDWEKRYKDTQKSIQERSIENKSLKAENDALAKQLTERTRPSYEVPEELDELKYSDPEAWRDGINKLEQEARAKAKAEQDEILSAARSGAASQAELDRRNTVFEAFQTLNPGLKITDETLANDVPPRISKRLEAGETSFEEFLNEVKNYMTAERTITKAQLQGDPNLAHVAGSTEPSLEAKKGNSKQSYANEIY